MVAPMVGRVGDRMNARTTQMLRALPADLIARGWELSASKVLKGEPRATEPSMSVPLTTASIPRRRPRRSTTDGRANTSCACPRPAITVQAGMMRGETRSGGCGRRTPSAAGDGETLRRQPQLSAKRGIPDALRLRQIKHVRPNRRISRRPE